jgi:hypothetical protein
VVSPTLNIDLVFREMFDAFRLRNTCVRANKDREAALNAFLLSICPDYAALQQAAEDAEAAYDALDKEVLQRNQAARRRVTTREDRQALAAAKTRKNQAKQAAWAAKRTLYARDDVKAESARLQAEYKAARYAAYQASGIYWGTRAAVEESLVVRKGRQPVFHKWNGKGTVQLQIQKVYSADGKGMTVAEAMSGTSSLLQILPLPPRPPKVRNGVVLPSTRQRDPQLYVARIRIGYNQEQQEPIWTEIPFRMHRPFPEGCRIKVVNIDRRRNGTRYYWRVRFGIAFLPEEHPNGPPPNVSRLGPPATPVPRSDYAAVGLDVGWRIMPCRGLRVAAWRSDIPIDVDYVHAVAERLGVPPWVEQSGTWGELIIPMHRITTRGDTIGGWAAWMKVDSLQSIRDQHLNAIRDHLASWRRSRLPSLPAWWRERTVTLHAWKSQNRLAALVRFWALDDNRFDGDADVLELALAWLRRDRHLFDWQESYRDRTLTWRQHLYRNFAASLARSFSRAMLEDLDWAKLQERPGPEKEPIEAAIVKFRRVAAVGKLKEAVKERMPWADVAPAFTTQRCWACGEIERFDKKDLLHTCEQCGESWDQDHGAAKILLAVGRGEMIELTPAGTPV